jgi:hypothetical protein
MTLIVADRVMETSTTTGTGAFTLAAAVTGYRRFSAVCSTNDTLYYAIEALDSNGNPSGDWEVGLGTYSGTNTLTRTTVQFSSNANSAVNFAAGSKRVILSATASYFGVLSQLVGLSFSQGDVLYHNGSQLTRLGAGTNGQFLRTNGAAANPSWSTVAGGGNGWSFSPPLAADFTLFSGDATSATLTDNSNAGLIVTTGAAAATAVVRGGYKALPAVGTDFSVTARVQLTSLPNNNQAGGLILYESGTGKAHCMLLFEAEGNHQLRRQTIGGTYSADTKYVFGPAVFDAWMKISRVGTTLSFSRSGDGVNFKALQSIAQTTYLTTAPDRIGPAVWLGHATDIPVLTVSYWAQTGF